ncbi:45754_t:CDS:2, partial [Gigaspora margarita]
PIMKIIQVYSTLNIYLILFVALLTIILPLSKSEQTDPNFQCQNVSKAFEKNELVEYDDAKKCIESFPFDAKLAADVIINRIHLSTCSLIKELESLRKETFKSDYDFVAALRNIISKLKDGNTQNFNICYQNFIYDQNLTLYSVITTDNENKQKQVFDDKLDPSNNDCEATEIDGKPALQAIIDFANDNIIYSKDLGVRFNMALAPSIGIFSQLFTLRKDLPETSNVTYNLKCLGKSYTLTRKWSVAFSNTAFENFCFDLRNFSAKMTSGDKSTGSTSSDRFKASASGNKNNINCVAVITDEISNSIFVLADGLRQLNERGAEKLILDMSNNIGGDVTSVSIFTILLLFPSKKQPYFFPTSININNFTIPVIKKNFDTHSDESDFYNPYTYLSFPSGEPFKNASEFIGPLTNLTSSLHLHRLTPAELQLLNSTSPFRWTNDDIIIMTNGFCVDKSGDKTPDVPRINALILNIREAYDFNNDNIRTGVLEYLFKPADYRLYYNESNARDSSFLWVDAANILNKKQ